MVVMILEKVPASLRGELTRWLIEPRPGVFVGHVSAMVRDRLWEKCIKDRKGQGGLIQIWSTNTEQRFDIRTWGDTDRTPVEFEGLWLIRKTKATRTSKPATDVNS
ncbi:MAG: type I-E CRISPR-associated endoribonuclease Cas2 [Chloroflexi bacterium]|nr:type I-E CRISPR-associated endoribonuclease Cas2 [Chloroflexota bacterium]